MNGWIFVLFCCFENIHPGGDPGAGLGHFARLYQSVCLGMPWYSPRAAGGCGCEGSLDLPAEAAIAVTHNQISSWKM